MATAVFLVFAQEEGGLRRILALAAELILKE